MKVSIPFSSGQPFQQPPFSAQYPCGLKMRFGNTSPFQVWKVWEIYLEILWTCMNTEGNTSTLFSSDLCAIIPCRNWDWGFLLKNASFLWVGVSSFFLKIHTLHHWLNAFTSFSVSRHKPLWQWKKPFRTFTRQLSVSAQFLYHRCIFHFYRLV